MGANPRSTVGTATDAHAMLRIIFSRLGYAAHRLAPGVLLQRRVDLRRGRGDHRARRVDDEGASSFSITGGMCPRCEGLGSVTDFDLTALYDASLSLNEGAITFPGFTRDLVRPDLPRLRLLRPRQAAARLHQKELQRSSTEPTKVKTENINLTYVGLVDKIRRASRQGPRRAAAGRPGAVERISFTVCPDCDGTRLNALARSSKVNGKTSPISAPCRSATWPTVRGLDDRGRPPPRGLLRPARLDGPYRPRLPEPGPRSSPCPAERRSAPRWSATSARP